MTEPRFAAGDLVRVRSDARRPAVWRVQRRDYWWTDTEPAYELHSSAGHVRFAFDSELERVEAWASGVMNGVSGGSPANGVRGND